MSEGGKSPGDDNIPAELIKNGGEAMISSLTSIICNKIWETGEWPTPWTKSMIINVPNKGNLQICNNYRIISLISHPSKDAKSTTFNTNKIYTMFSLRLTGYGMLPYGRS